MDIEYILAWASYFGRQGRPCMMYFSRDVQVAKPRKFIVVYTMRLSVLSVV